MRLKSGEIDIDNPDNVPSPILSSDRSAKKDDINNDVTDTNMNDTTKNVSRLNPNDISFKNSTNYGQSLKKAKTEGLNDSGSMILDDKFEQHLTSFDNKKNTQQENAYREALKLNTRSQS